MKDGGIHGTGKKLLMGLQLHAVLDTRLPPGGVECTRPWENSLNRAGDHTILWPINEGHLELHGIGEKLICHCHQALNLQQTVGIGLWERSGSSWSENTTGNAQWKIDRKLRGNLEECKTNCQLNKGNTIPVCQANIKRTWNGHAQQSRR